ncbi:sialate O-acetylesterase-like [Cloeon dipterum]|uniref:sialate O-acetylesterase-like n=1 Tax=Cloeon dipterum TaxID=197152 RepID=UPI00322071EA
MQNLLLFSALVAYALLQTCDAQSFRLSNTFQSNMMLQQSPKRARIWGYGQIGATVLISFEQFSDSVTIGGNATWSFIIPAHVSGGPHSILIEHNARIGLKESALLENVYFGDIWLCAGEGNMELPMKDILDSTTEIENVMQYSSKIWTAKLQPSTASRELNEPYPYNQAWSQLKAENVPEFSALCLLYATRLLDQVPDHPPIGLIQATYASSNIEGWISTRVIDVCNTTQSPEFGQGLVEESSIWNAMIHPLTSNSIRGVIWHQGESNVQYNLPYYTCQFKNLTFDWADTFFDGTVPTTPEGWYFPFGFVQLGPMEGENDQLVSDLRLHQTFDTEVAPNNFNNETFMAPAYDLYDPSSPFGSVYFRDKQTVARRLAHSFVFLYYDRFDLEFVGPIPSIRRDDLTMCTVTYSWQVQFNGQAGDPSGFYFRRLDGVWVEAPIYNVTSDTLTYMIEETATEMAYGWSAKPCDYKSCPVYSTDRGPDGLPAIIMSFPLFKSP